jgi:bifunctional DNase/RNase
MLAMKIKVEQIKCVIPPIPIGNAAIRLIGSGKHIDMGNVPIDQALMIDFAQNKAEYKEEKKKAGEERLHMEELLEKLLPQKIIREVCINVLDERGCFEAEVTINSGEEKDTTVKAVPSAAISLGLIVGAEIFMNSELCRDFNHAPAA